MTKNSAFTLVEIVMVSAIIVLVTGLIYSMYFHVSRNADRQDKEQLYYQKLTSLEARIRQDLRSSLAFQEEAPGVFSIKTIYMDESNNPSIKDIIYWVDESGRGVERHDKNASEVKTFDFSGLLGDNEQFIFRLK